MRTTATEEQRGRLRRAICAALDRSELCQSLPGRYKAAVRSQKNRRDGQLSLFDEADEETSGGDCPPEVPPLDEELFLLLAQSMADETEVLGCCLSMGILDLYYPYLMTRSCRGVGAVAACRDPSASVRVAGVVEELQVRRTRAGRPFASFTLRGNFDAAAVIAWPECYAACKEGLTNNAVVIAQGRVKRDMIMRGEQEAERVVLVADSFEAVRPRAAAAAACDFYREPEASDGTRQPDAAAAAGPEANGHAAGVPAETPADGRPRGGLGEGQATPA